MNAKTSLFIILFSLINFSQAETQQEMFERMKAESHESKVTRDAKRLKAIYEKYKSVPAMLKSISMNRNITKEMSMEIAKKALTDKSNSMDSIGSFISYRITLAGNPSVDPETLRLLSQIPTDRSSFYSFIHKALAGNPNTPYDILTKLSEYYDYAVDLAGNSSYKQKDLRELYKKVSKLHSVRKNIRLHDSGQRIMLAFLDNKNITKKLAKDIYKSAFRQDTWWILLKKQKKGVDISYTVKNIRKQAIKSKKFKCDWLYTQVRLDEKAVRKDIEKYCSKKSSEEVPNS